MLRRFNDRVGRERAKKGRSRTGGRHVEDQVVLLESPVLGIHVEAQAGSSDQTVNCGIFSHACCQMETGCS